MTHVLPPFGPERWQFEQLGGVRTDSPFQSVGKIPDGTNSNRSETLQREENAVLEKC